MMSLGLSFLCGLGAGAFVAWSVASFRLSRAQSRASGAESAATELRAQVEKARGDFDELRARAQEVDAARVQAETRHSETLKHLQEQTKLIEESRKALTDTFKSLSHDALQSNNRAFLELAKKSLEAVLAEGKGDFEKRRQAVEELVKPLREALSNYEEHVRDIEGKRQTAYASLEEQVKALNQTQRMLRDKTDNLVTALRRPEVRGRWGEITLRRVAELAGMSGHCDFEEQVTSGEEGSSARPDMLVHLPAGRQIVVDSKLSLDAYLDSVSAGSDEERNRHLARHARQMRNHMKRLATKSYWEQFPEAPEFVVMFIPGESFFAAAVERDPNLIEDGMQERVVLATPTTLVALLHAVAYGWRQETLTQNAQVICDLGRQLYDRLQTFSEHFDALRRSLEQATEAYNRAVGSMEARVFPAARRFKELRVSSGKDIEAAGPVESTPRALSSPDAEQDES